MPVATIIVKDECNIKISGVELHTRKKLVDKFKYKVPGAYFIPSVRLGRWDGTISFFNLGGSTYTNLLPDIIPILEQDGYQLDLQDNRPYSHNINFQTPVREDSYSHLLWPAGHPVEHTPIMLRDYQIEVINGFLQDTQSIQEVATGAGKTLITAILSHQCEPYGRTIVIVPNKSLVTQTEDDYLNLRLDVGVFFGDRKEFGHKHTICTWQSLGLMMKKSRAKQAIIPIEEFIEDVVCVIVDEAHISKANILKDLLTGPMACIPIRWGLTGTIPKEDMDRVSLMCSIGHVTNRVSAKDLQDKGVLANCHVNVLQLIDLKEYGNYQAELKYLLTDDKRQDYMAKIILEVNKTGSTLILVDRVQAGKDIVLKINEQANAEVAVFISGATKAGVRKDHYDEVKEATGKILVCTYGVAAVGINIPRIFNVMLIEPGKSFVRVIQSIGRGLRMAKDKDFVQVWDITSTCKFAKRHLTQRKKWYKDAGYPFTIEKVDWQ